MQIKTIRTAAIFAFVALAIQIIERVAFSVVSDNATSTSLAQWIISLFLIFLIQIGAHIYYREAHRTHKSFFEIGLLIIYALLEAILSAPLLL